MLDIKKLLEQSKHFLLVAFLIFCVGSWLGFSFYQQFESFFVQVMEQLEDIVEQLEEKDSSLYAAWFIFQNNARVALLMMVMGIFLFFIPMVTLLSNGIILGIVLKLSAVEGIAPLKVLLFGILPHGILELPALFVACGLGSFMGWRLLLWVFGRDKWLAHLLSPDKDIGQFWREKGKPVLVSRYKSVGTMIVIVVLALFVAAVIEAYITPFLIGATM